ncbi:MAG: hypothetical protein PVH29_07210 [Candidatus Zixiibacteriota bacterium]|jgi:exopolyphosphatase/guanosine-5'-triphosphate,3'-diphosphate pyrophosphatase
MALETGGRPAVVEEDMASTRLGAGLGRNEISAQAVERTAAAVTAYVARARQRGADEVKIVGTAALRRDDLRRAFERALGPLPAAAFEVLSPEKEGALVLLAGRRSLPLSTGLLTAVDVGGGSAQIARETGPAGGAAVRSYPIGCVAVTERFLGETAGDADAWDRAALFIRGQLADVRPAAGDVIVTGGTATAAVAVELGMGEYDADEIRGRTVSAVGIASLGRRVYDMPVAERRRLAGMPPARADIFPAGALAVAAVLEALGVAEAVVSVQGVRFGVAYECFGDIG